MSQSEAPFAIHVSREAAERIQRTGGRLFLWQRPVGRGWSRDFMSLMAPPTDIAYDCFPVRKRDVQICITRDMDAPREVIVRSRRWPFRGVRVYVDGKRWGWRGSAAGAGG